MSGKRQSSILSFFNQKTKVKSTTKARESSSEKGEIKPELTNKENVSTKKILNKKEVSKKENATTALTTPKKIVNKKVTKQDTRVKDVINSDDDRNSEDDDPRPSRNKRKRAIIESDSDDEVPIVKKKSKRPAESESEEFDPGEDSSSDDNMEQDVIESAEDTTQSEDSPVKPKKTLKLTSNTAVKGSVKKAKSKPSLNSTLSNISAFEANDDAEEKTVWDHEKLDWLKESKLTDRKKNLPSSEDYDPTTLYVPESFIKGVTPGMGNWWKIKSKNYDAVIFYKVGKFYEMYHMDAVIGVGNCGLTFMKGNYAHCGFPEMRFEHFSSMLVNKGFKVARVEQTETQELNKERVKKSLDWYGTKKPLDKLEKQTRREVCRISTPGTRVSAFTGFETLAAAETLIAAVFEHNSTTGIAFCDTSQGELYVGEFEDDSFCSNLRTLLAHRNVTQLVHQKYDLVSPNLRQILSSLSSDLYIEKLPNKLFTTADKCTKVIRETETEEIKMTSLLDLIEKNPVGARAVGALISQLKRYEILHEVLRTSTFSNYVSPCNDRKKVVTDPNRRMILDSMTLTNLEITCTASGSEYGSLIKRIDTCSSAGGKRRLRELLIAPSSHSTAILEKQQLIKVLMANDEFCKSAKKLLSKLPDLSRLISRFGNLSYGIRPDDHPDKRAVLYEEILYNKQKTNTFCSVLEAYGKIYNWLVEIKAMHLDEILALNLTIGKGFPDISELLSEWKTCFDVEKARKEGKLVPKEGTNVPFDTAVSNINQTTSTAEQYRAKYDRKFGYAKLLKAGKMSFVLDVKETVDTPEEWTVIGSRKGFKKYITPKLAELNADMDRYKNQKDIALHEASSVIFHRFYAAGIKWLMVARRMEQLDADIALANYGRSLDQYCFPEFTDECGVLEIFQGRHPTIMIELWAYIL